MKTFIKLLSLTVGLVLSMQAVAVAKVEITWTNPEKYRRKRSLWTTRHNQRRRVLQYRKTS
jgi:hypothetical protein